MRRWWHWGVASVATIGACSDQYGELTRFDAPPTDDFHYVGEMLHRRCGSLDCHGRAERPLRLYGRYGLRLSPTAISGSGPSTPGEIEANYASVIALEPEILAAVLRDGGDGDSRLTLMRKALGAEAHAGGRALDAKGAACVRSWLTGSVDAKTCFEATPPPSPPGWAGSGGTGGTAGSGGSGGSGGTAGAGGTAGTAASGGSAGSSGGSGGSGGTGATGGGGTGGGGTGGGGGVQCFPGDFWPCTFDEKCKPLAESPAGHEIYVSTDCQSCHGAAATGATSKFLFAGAVLQFPSGKAAPGFEVGLRDPTAFHIACTDALGFFFVSDNHPEPNWKETETRVRGPFGEKIMPDDKEHKASCNEAKCHGDPEHRIWAP